MQKMHQLTKYICILLCCFVLVTATVSCAPQQTENDGITIVSSFYPVYVTVLNLTDGIDGVNAINLTPYATGCLHDYQLTTENLKTLERADIFVQNGAGMEVFTDKVVQNCPDLTIIEASKDIATIDDNAHIWLSISQYTQYVKNISQGLITADPSHATQYEANTEIYLQKIQALQTETTQLLSNLTSRNIIVFHEAFPYFAEEFNLNIVATVEREPDEAPVARELAETCDLIEETGCLALFAEPDYSQAAIDVIARETGATVYILDPITEKKYENDKDAYLLAMQQNAKTLKEALS